MIEQIKAFFTRDGWAANWGIYLFLVGCGAVIYILGAFGGALIQAIKDM